MAVTIPESVIVLAFIIVLLFIVFKTGTYKRISITRSSGSTVKGSRTLKVNYSILKGPIFFRYVLKKNHPYIFHYNIEVAKGSLAVKMKSRSGKLFDEKFIENGQGSIEITSKTRVQLVIIEGKNFKGKCGLEFEEMY